MRHPIVRGCLAALFLAAAVAGCSRVPLGSLWTLRQFDFEGFDPGALRIAAYLPNQYELIGDGLRIDAKVKRADLPVQVERFGLQRSREPADLSGLVAPSTGNGRWVVLRFDAVEAERVRALRRKLLAQKAASGGKGGSLEIGASPKLCHTGAAPQGDAKVTASLMWSRETGYVTLLRETDMETLLGAFSEDVDLPRC